jgi:hypothetical protein
VPEVRTKETTKTNNDEKASDDSPTRRGWFARFEKKPNANKSPQNPDKNSSRSEDVETDTGERKMRRGWFSRSDKKPAEIQPPRNPVDSKPSSGDMAPESRSWSSRLLGTRKDTKTDSEANDVPPTKRRLKLPQFSKMSLPKFKLPSFRLPPPTSDEETSRDGSPQGLRATTGDRRPLPGTGSSSSSQTNSSGALDAASRNLSKAERKKMKRSQRDDDSDRRAA